MDKAILKRFATESRKDLMDKVKNKIKTFLKLRSIINPDEEFEKLEKSNADLVICGCKKVYDWNKKIEDYDFFHHNKKELDLFVTSTVWTYVFKNKFKMKFDEAISYGEDDLFSFLLSFPSTFFKLFSIKFLSITLLLFLTILIKYHSR